MDYSQAINTLNGRKSRKLENNTYLKLIDNQTIGVLLHDTYVVTFKSNGDIILNSGGWLTVTTKDRINKYADNIRIIQRNNIWTVYYYNDNTLFFDGLTINHGEFINKKTDKQTDRELKQMDKIKKQVKNYLIKLDGLLDKNPKYTEGSNICPIKLGFPSGGDCWYCAFKDKEGKTWGDMGDNNHLYEHLKQKYVVPSLVCNAVTEVGYQNPGLIIYGMVIKDSVKRAVRKYFYKRLLK